LTKKFQYRQRSSIQWLYLRHHFLQAYFASHKPTIETNEPSSSKTQSQILSYVDSIEAIANKLSKEIDYELNIFREHNNAFLKNNNNCASQYHPFVHKTSKTSNRPKTNSSNSGLPTHHVPQVYFEHTTSPISPLHLHGEEDPGTPCESSIFSWSFTNTTTPLLPPTGDSHGCNMSPSGNENHPQQLLQPYEPVCNNNRHTKQTIEHSTIYTQNARGLWHRRRDPDGNILVDAPPDLSKLKYIIDYMRQQDVGAWLIQETWEEGDDFNAESGGYLIFCHNADRGANGCHHLYKGVAIILSPLFHKAWRLTGSPSPFTMDPKDDFTGWLI
jgi:hypothetical protein